MKVIREPDRGGSDAINKGIKMARGNVCGLLNADDLLPPWSLTLVADAFARRPLIDCVYGDTLLMHMGAGFATINFSPRPARINRHLNFDGIFSMSMFWRRQKILELGLFDESFALANDYEFEIRAARAGFRFHKVEAPLACFRWRYSSLSIRDPLSFKSEIGRIRQKYFEGKQVQILPLTLYKLGWLVSHASGFLTTLSGRHSVLREAGLVSNSRLVAYFFTAPLFHASIFTARLARNGFVDANKLLALIAKG